jgi:subtilisin family serine protease
VHAFDDTPGVAHGNSFAIYKGLQWAADNGARVVNMSFAGPADPTLQHMLAAAYDKGMVLIAAAGNGGPKSGPLYPAADPNVIAVTATDSDDHLFPMANRGRYIAVSAPGVEIFALAPGDEYLFTTGTSIAAAHVSGIAALLLERRPSLKPSDIRAILTVTAKPLEPPRPDSDFGAGLVSAYRAVMWLERSPPAPADGGTQAKQ